MSVDIIMQNWFNGLNFSHSSLLTILSNLIGAKFFHLRITDQIGFGCFISLGIFIEAFTLNIKKYIISDVAHDHGKNS